MPISIVTFADLGKKNNLKTIDVLPIIKIFDEKKKLSNIFCRINTGFYFRNTKGMISFLCHIFLKILERVSFYVFSARKIEERLCDSLVSCEKKLNNPVFFLPEYFFSKSVSSIQKQGLVSVGFATMAHPGFNAFLEEEENLILKIKNKKNHSIYKSIFNSNKNINEFSYIIAYSDFVKKTYIDFDFPESRIFVAQNDIDIKRFPLVDKKESGIFKVLYVANTNTLKGLHYLLNAWSFLGLKNAELILVGGYSNSIPRDLKSNYKRIIKNNSSIKWVNFTSFPEEYYLQANVFVMPSLTEGNPRVVMEAMASGLPVITTENAVGLVKDKENGYIVPIRNSGALAERIKFLYDNRKMCLEMGKKSREIMENKKGFSEEVFKIYQDILKREDLIS